jgi:hypothetical protein
VAVTDLRPAGYVRLDVSGAGGAGAPVDVVTRGEYLPAGAAVEVVADEGYRRVVRLRPSRHPQVRPETGPRQAPEPAPEGSRSWKAS